MSATLAPSELAAIRQRAIEALTTLPRSIGRYEIRGELGHGGMGIVFDAWDPTLERAVAIKVLHEERIRGARDRARLEHFFEREMRATSDLFDPHLVSILDAGFESGGASPRVYYVMERVEGESLEHHLTRVGALPRRRVLELAAQIARGLAAAHAHGLIHRDLKPANVLLTPTGAAKVADFGLCALRDEIAGRSGAGLGIGSAHYAAPEQIRGDASDAAADLFSLGAVILRMWTGRDPFSAQDLPGHLESILRDAPEDITSLPGDVRELVERLLHKDPNARPKSAARVAEELEALAVRPPHGRRVRQVAIALSLLLFTLGVVGLGARARLESLDANAKAQWAQVETQLARRAALLPALTELSNDAKIGDTYRNLRFEIEGTHNRVAIESLRYNEAVDELNRRLARMPWRWIAGEVSPRPYASLLGRAGAGPE